MTLKLDGSTGAGVVVAVVVVGDGPGRTVYGH
jgi:hypothetical protein